MQKLTKLEHKSAANALVGWFNSQELGREDSLRIMEMVLAKLFIDQSTDLLVINDLYKAHLLRVAEYCADRVKRHG